MTYSTHAIDAVNLGASPAPRSIGTRHRRSRRRSAALGHTVSAGHVVGFGF